MNWLLKNVKIESQSRKEATKLGQKLLEKGVIVHVDIKGQFKDSPTLFTFKVDDHSLYIYI